MKRLGLFIRSHQGIRANIEPANQVGTKWGRSGDHVVVLCACVTTRSIPEQMDDAGRETP